MPGEYILDTNVVIALIDRRSASLAHRYREASAFVSTIAVGELLYGVEASAHRAANQSRLTQWISRLTVLPCDMDTARFYASIRVQLKRVGRPIPDNDIWIAATAMQHGLVFGYKRRAFQRSRVVAD